MIDREFTMNPENKPWTPSSIVLIMAGVTLIGVGLYFILLRPPLLPEDIRYMAMSVAQIDSVRPRLELWLAHVFQVMGGYVLATGALTITLAATSFRAHHWGAAVGALIGGAASIGLMAVVNFVIDSDFKWVLLGIALLWACSLVLFCLEKNSQRP
jgi:steroid 5-alpha reductase family enzyme